MEYGMERKIFKYGMEDFDGYGKFLFYFIACALPACTEVKFSDNRQLKKERRFLFRLALLRDELRI